MSRSQITAWQMLFAVTILAGLVCFVAGFVFVSEVFGVGKASIAFLLFAPLLVASIRLRRGWSGGTAA
jgi:hypothetical protein